MRGVLLCSVKLNLCQFVVGAIGKESAMEKYEDAVEEAVALCAGDIRGALKALIMANEFLEYELERLLLERPENQLAS